jgi:hypothetical protein
MKKEIEDFWDWFEENEEDFLRTLYQGTEEGLKQLKEVFDQKILAFGHFTWEINADANKKYQFVISPNREFELLQLAKNIIKEAPELEHWTFLYAKEKVSYIEPFKIYDESLDPHLVNVATWKYKLEGDTVLVHAPTLLNIDQDTEQHALDLVITAKLGEENRILTIQNIKKVPSSDDTFSSF